MRKMPGYDVYFFEACHSNGNSKQAAYGVVFFIFTSHLRQGYTELRSTKILQFFERMEAMQWLKRAVLLSAMGMSLVVISSARAADDANPRYTHWSRYKVGSNTTMVANVSTPQGMTINMEMKRTLKELTDDKAVIEVVSSTEVMGQSHPGKPHDEIIQAKKAENDAYKEVGHETVEAAGKSYDCTVIEATQTVPAGPGGRPQEGKAKVWVTDDVPGGMVKLEATGMSNQTVSFLLKSFEAK